MLCRNPFVQDKTGAPFASRHPRDWMRGVPFRCGKCLACRVASRREWTTRLILEMLSNPCGCFVTLSYSEDYVPLTESRHRTLSLLDLQLFFKRLRRNLESIKKRPVKFRYFAVGEYGARFTQRPHYHIIFFGVSDMDPAFRQAVYAAWSEPSTKGNRGKSPIYGNVTFDPLNAKTVAYVAGYSMKKLIKPIKVYKRQVASVEVRGRTITYEKEVLDRKKSNRDENGVLAEFRVMSRMPGLGSGMLGAFVELFMSSSAFRHVLLNTGDVPSTIRAFGRVLFLDSFLKRKLRELLCIEPDPLLYAADVRSQYFDWLRNGSPHDNFYVHLIMQDDQKFKQLEERIKRQLQKREKF